MRVLLILMLRKTCWAYHSRDVYEMLKNSPKLSERHKNVDEYLTKTIRNALGGGSNDYKI